MAFKAGELVLLSVKNLRLKLPTKKLSMKFVSPFLIEEKIGLQAYYLQLAKSYKIHNMFYVSLLLLYHLRASETLANVVAPKITLDSELV